MPDDERQPWQWPEGQWPPTLYGGLLSQARADRAVMAQVLRSAVDLVQGWVGVDLTWSTDVSVVEDGVGNTRADTRRAGVDWDFISGKPGTVDSIALQGVCTQLAQEFDHPNRVVVEISAHFPRYSAHYGRDMGRMITAVSVQRWALYGSGGDLPWFTPGLDRWMTQSAVALGAVGGFALLDRLRASHPQSPWDRHAKILADGAPGVWGYGWGTLLAPADLDRIGGLDVVLSLPSAHVEDLPGGRVWVTLGNDPSTVPDEVMRALHEALRPVLAQRAVFEQSVPAPASVPAPVTVEQLRQAWQEQSAATRAGGRSSGMFGPVGFSVPLLGLFAPVATDLLPDSLVFTGLGHQQAQVLLTVLSGALLDVQIGAGPTLRRTFQAMVDHPGLITASGLVFGPCRDDEGLMVDQVRVHGDPVLAGLEPDDIEAAYRRLIALGIEGAAEPEEVGPAADGDVWGFWWD